MTPLISPEPRRQTAGSKVSEFLHKLRGEQYEVGEIAPKIFNDWSETIVNIIDQNKGYAHKYYIVSHTATIPHLGNAKQIRTWHRHTIPTPAYNQDVFSFDPKDFNLKLEWTLPDRWNANAIMQAPYASDPELVRFIERYRSGELFAYADAEYQKQVKELKLEGHHENGKIVEVNFGHEASR